MKPYEIYLVHNKFNPTDEVTYLSALIRGVTGGDYNHVAIKVDGYVIEAIGKGVVRKPFEEWVAFSSRKVLPMLPPAPMTNPQYVKLRSLVGAKYGKGDLVRAGWYYLLEKRLKLDTGVPYNGQGYICSELATLLLGIDWFIVPHEFEKLEILTRGEIFHTQRGIKNILVPVQ